MKKQSLALTTTLAVSSILGGTLLASVASVTVAAHGNGDNGDTTTPIKHVVVLFQKNVSFDHYFGTYPHALNPAGEPAFDAKPDMPYVCELSTFGALNLEILR